MLQHCALVKIEHAVGDVFIGCNDPGAIRLYKNYGTYYLDKPPEIVEWIPGYVGTIIVDPGHNICIIHG
jgi:hypothetical protein